jgi:hypothetical protein
VETLYDTIGALQQLPPPRPRITTASMLSWPAASIVNIGGGVGSYEPRDRDRCRKPSWLMILQRAKSGPPVVQARAESFLFGRCI